MGEYFFIASAIFSVVNGTVLLWVSPRRLINKVFFSSSVWIAVWFLCIILAVRAGREAPFASQPVVFWVKTSSVVAAFSVWLIWLMKSVLLEDRATAATIIKRSWPWFTASLTLALLASTESFIPSTSTPETEGRGIGYFVYTLITIFCCSFLLIDALRQMRRLTGVRKIEMRFFVVGTLCACLLVVASHAFGLWLDISWLRHSSFVWFSALHGITVWAVCSHRVFDAKQVILSIGQRLALLIAVGLAALALHHALSFFLSPVFSLLCTAVCACAAGIALDGQTRRYVGLDPKLRLAGPRKQIIDWAREIPDERELRENFIRLFCDQCQTDSVVFLSSNGTSFNAERLNLSVDWPGFSALCKDGWSTPETLQRSRTEAGASDCADLMQNQEFGALIAVPKGCRPPSLVIGLGRKESMRPYTFPDIQVLLELAELMDNILTHSRAATHAARIERMASATMISRGLAHDLNNLATPVSTFLHHMDERVISGTIEAKVLADAKSSINVMQDYIQESLFFARQLIPKLAVIEAHALLNDVVSVSSERAHRINAHVIICEGPNFSFVADLALLRRLLQNLVFNGIDASASGNTVEISASVTDDQQVCLQVADHGAGIPPEIQNRIFEPYYTTKGSGTERRGLGLGLAICQKIAEIHGGRISVSANTSHGAVFTTTFPRRNRVPVMSPTKDEEELLQDQEMAESIRKFGPSQTVNGINP